VTYEFHVYNKVYTYMIYVSCPPVLEGAPQLLGLFLQRLAQQALPQPAARARSVVLLLPSYSAAAVSVGACLGWRGGCPGAGGARLFVLGLVC
jgi:hypothetical protein